MILSLLSGLTKGFLMAVPPGPASTTLIKLNLTHYRKHIIAYASGVACLDVVYSLVAMLAASNLLSAYKYLDLYFPLSIIVFQGIMVVFLIYFGFRSLKEIRKVDEFNPDEPIKVKKKLIPRINLDNPFLLAMAMSFTGLAGPSFFPSLVFICGMEQEMQFVSVHPFSKVIFSLAYGMGTFVWLILLSKIIHTNKHRFNPRIIKIINLFVSLSLIFFGIVLLVKLVLYYS